jgi:hypothetical protein
MARQKRKEVDTGSEGFSVESKIQEIRDSRMPEGEKEAYIARLTVEPTKEDAVPFAVYAMVNKVPKHLHGAMLVFAKKDMASMEEWEKIFKKF